MIFLVDLNPSTISILDTTYYIEPETISSNRGNILTLILSCLVAFKSSTIIPEHLKLNLHISLYPPLHIPLLQMSISTICHYFTWPYPILATSTHEHIHHWPAIHISVATIDQLCIWTYLSLTTTAHEHIYYWPLPHMSISTIDHHCTWAYLSLTSPAHEHIPQLTTFAPEHIHC